MWHWNEWKGKTGIGKQIKTERHWDVWKCKIGLEKERKGRYKNNNTPIHQPRWRL